MHTTNVIVLNTRGIGEYDQIVSLYTKKFGKIRVVVKSARKITTKQGNFLHTLGVYECSFISGRSGYILAGIQSPALSQVEQGKKTYFTINSDLFALGYITSFLKLVDSVIYDNQQDGSIWKLLTSSLTDAEKIIQNGVDIQSKLWQREKLWVIELLDILGLRPQTFALDNIRTQRELDKYLKEILENKFEEHISLFGFK